jgi:hydroxymethylbilane synthase
MKPLRIGTRGSPLALWQAHFVADRLRQWSGTAPIAVIEIETAGDRIREVGLGQLGGEGVFTKEIQRALLADKVDVAVHSLKDLPTTAIPGLTLAAVPARGPAGDVLVSHRHRTFDQLPAGATVATSSLRRRAQVVHRRPDLRLVDIRGNVDTRLRKLQEQNLDALFLAEAGLVRLGLDQVITEVLDQRWMLPAVGQGALGLECRTDDQVTGNLLQLLNDAPTHQAVLAERALLRSLGGGCQLPLGAIATVDRGTLRLRGAVLAPDGSSRIDDEERGPAMEAEAIGVRLAQGLLDQGARDLLGRW